MSLQIYTEPSKFETIVTIQDAFINSLTSGNAFFNITNEESLTLLISSNVVGINTEYPSEALTVVGNISATNIIYASNGNSTQWNSAYSSWNSASATSVVSYNDTRFSKLSSQAYQLISSTKSIIPTNGSNTASGCYSNVAGGVCNAASARYSTIVGGLSGRATGEYSFVGGGKRNTASGRYSNVTNGYLNTASGCYSNVAGGATNTASGYYSNVAGGVSNTASGYGSNVAGGDTNLASGYASHVAGGYSNIASGCYSSILGGIVNNTNSQCNTFILGSYITASQPNFTYVNNLSSQGTIFANTFRVGSSVTTATGPVGTVVRKIQIFDSEGNSLGFIPVYDSIT
jgi:hypothetical protein